MSLDTAPCGLSTAVSTRQIADIVNAALDQGVNFIDSARTSGKAEEGIGLALGRRRRETFLSTKVWADTTADAERSLAASLRSLKTDYVDLLYFQNLGTRNFEEATGPDGVFTWLLKQKQSGKTRFVGISGHNLSERFPAYIRTNQIFGGVRGRFGARVGQKPVPQMPEEYLELAVRYVLNLPGVTAANIGVYDAGQLPKNIARVGNLKPLTPREQNLLDLAGRKLAAQWRPHFGPIATCTSTA
ncbi:MAG: aldo/keto reductase [Thermoguttaceae bacterium]